ncbi:MAG: HAD family hydrolase [Dehalococcoidia bacterium]|nr:HAD family hydrolase [Dehalococcoidia bacterium]
MPTLRGVTLDLWHTLIKDSPEVGQQRYQYRMGALQELLAGAGVPITQEQLLQASRACFQACEGTRSQARELSFADQVDLFLDLVTPGLAARLPRAFVAHVRDVYGCMPPGLAPTVAPGAPDVLKALRGEGYSLALISNTGVTPGKSLRRLLDEMGLLQHLSVLVFSDEVGMVKPAPGIFHTTLHRMGLLPEHAVHVGDHPHADVLGASRVGMWTVQVETAEPREPAAEPHVRIPRLADLPEAIAQIQRGLR